jgi:hypothetical protein
MRKEIQERSRTYGSQSYSTCNLRLGFTHNKINEHWHKGIVDVT